MTPREAAILMAYTGITFGDFQTFHQYVEEKFGRPVQSAEFGFNADQVKLAATDDFVALHTDVCRQAAIVRSAVAAKLIQECRLSPPVENT